MNQENPEFLDENLDHKADNTPENTENDSNEAQIASVEEELKNQKDQNLRLFAEFENYKKRTTKERLELYKTANETLLSELLPVLDDFERAMNEIQRAEDDVLMEGVNLIQNKFISILKSKGLNPIETSIGDDFNLDYHEAITQVPAPSEDLVGKIVDIIETGYTLNDKVIRYTKVVVGK